VILTPAVLWILGYVAVVSLPLLVLLARRVPGGAGFWWDLSMGLGIGGLAVMGAQTALTARFRRASAPFGIDILYYFHRWMAIGALLLLGAHWLVLRATAPAALAPALPWTAPWEMTAGRVALLLLVALVASSLWRKPLRIEYDRWRVAHAALAVGAVVLAVLHVRGVGSYARAPLERAVWVGYGSVWLGLTGFVRLWRPLRLRARPYRVTAVRPAPGRSWTVTLEPDGHPGLRFRPGQFAWLTLRHSPFAFREHPFSFSGSAGRAPELEFTIRELGDFTRTIGDVRPGERAYVDGPYGSFTVDRYPTAPGFVLVAGGVGIAPLVCMLRTLADRGDRRLLRLVYANDRWEDVLFREELEALKARLDLEVEHVLAEPPPGWTGATGYVTADVLRRVVTVDPRSLVYFLCGPRPMSDTVQRALHGMGVPLHRIHFELFDMA
jgi:predicted ferric reductase